ncbi:MAG: EamA family transporter RarD [Pseudomonadota bacterium]
MTTKPPPGAVAQSSLRTGLIAAIAAYTFWGGMPIYLKAVSDALTSEILVHRIIWSVPFGALILAMRKQWRETLKAFMDIKVIVILAISALAISLNWLTYIWAVVNDRILEASLGYYINPLMYVAAGVILFGEKLRAAQIIAVALATIGVLVLTIGVGVFPWISILLAVLFTIYGYIRKTAPVGAMPGLFIETVLLTPFAVVYLFVLMSAGTAAFLQQSAGLDILLVLAGPVTVIPLVLFAVSTRILTLTTVGFLQYIGPTIQFILGLYYGEPFALAHALCFGLIWSGLAVFSIDAVRASRSAAGATKEAEAA